MVDISALFGGSTSTTSAPLVSAYGGLKRYVQNEPQQIATYVKTPAYKADLAYFNSHIGKVTSADQLTKDPRLLKFVLTAFNLTADTKYPAKIAAVLKSDLTNTNSMANRLIDPRYRQLAQAFNFNLVGTANLKSSSFLSSLVSKFTTNGYEQSLSDVNPALRTAAYFLRNIGNVTDTFQILGDGVLRSVVVQALNLPPEIVNQSIEKQKALIDSKLDIKKFALPSTSSTTAGPKTPLDAATAEQAALLNTRNVVGAARVEVQTLQERTVNIQTAYQQLATNQDVSGPYAAEIPAQQQAAPVLVEQKGLLAAASDATGSINTNMAKLQALVQQAGNPSNTTPLSDLQAQFTTAYNAINATIQNATYVNTTTGATENLLDGSTANITSPAYNSQGAQTSVRSYNLSSGSAFGTQLTAAYNAFTAGTPDLSGAAAALSTAKPISDVTSQTVNVDQTSFTNAVASVPVWAGTYDTAQLYKGSTSVADASSRIVSVNQILAQIQSLAQQSSSLAPADDRTTLQTSYDTLITQLGTAIGTAGTGADNLLNTTAVNAYNIDLGGTTAARVRGSDLATSVQNVLAGLDVSSASTANAVIAAITGSIHDAIALTGTNLKVDSQALNLAANTLDPRSTVDSQYRQLVADIPAALQNAGWNGSNLLDPTQAPITVTSSATKMVITINPETTIDANFTQVLKIGSQGLPSDATDMSGAIAAVNDAVFNINGVLSHLTTQIHQIDFAKTLTDNQVKDLQKKADTAAAADPIKATDFAVQFLKKYLISVDAQNSGISSSTGSSAYLALFQNAASGFKTSA